jgi:hypothetical protein
MVGTSEYITISELCRRHGYRRHQQGYNFVMAHDGIEKAQVMVGAQKVTYIKSATIPERGERSAESVAQQLSSLVEVLDQ